LYTDKVKIRKAIDKIPETNLITSILNVFVYISFTIINPKRNVKNTIKIIDSPFALVTHFPLLLSFFKSSISFIFEIHNTNPKKIISAALTNVNPFNVLHSDAAPNLKIIGSKPTPTV
jgi:hypothetical protein